MSRVKDILMTRTEEGELTNQQYYLVKEIRPLSTESQTVIDEEGTNVAELNTESQIAKGTL